MKTLFLILCSILSIQTFAQINLVADEEYLSRNLDMQPRGSNQFLSVLQALQVPYRVNINNLFVVASTAAGRGTIDIQMNGRSLIQRQVGTVLEIIQVPIFAELGITLQTLDIITNGNFHIAHLGVTLQSSFQPGPGPGPTPIPPTPPQPPPVNGEEVVFTERVEGQYFQSSSSGSSANARNTYEQSCAKWKDDMYRLVQGVRYVHCGEVSDVGGSSGYQYRSQGRVTVLAPRDRQRFTAFLSGDLLSSSESNAKARALESHNQLCQAYKDEMVNLNRGRLVFVTCGEAQDVGGSSYKYRSEASVFVTNVGQTRIITEGIRGFPISSSQPNAKQMAMNEFRQRCSEWKAEVMRYNSFQVISMDCGEPVDVGGSSKYQYQSQSSAVLSQF